MSYPQNKSEIQLETGLMLSEEKTVNRTNTKTHSKPHKKMKDSSKKGP